MGDKVIDQLLMLYTNVKRIDDTDYYGVLADDKVNVVTKDGDTIFKEDKNLYENTANYVKLITQTYNNDVSIGILYKKTGNAFEFNDLEKINDVGDYLLIESKNKRLTVLNNKSGEELWSGQIRNYRVRMGDKKTPITIVESNGNKLVISDCNVVKLLEHLKNKYKTIEKIKGTKSFMVQTNGGNKIELNQFGQIY